MIRRRDFIAGLGGAAAWPVVARAQQTDQMRRVGVLAGAVLRSRAAFFQGLSEPGYTIGRNVALEERAAEGQNDKVPGFLSDLIARRVAVIATLDSTATALAAKMATQTIPIVFRIGGDPIASGLVSSLNHPGGNITGTTTLGGPLGAKRLELLHELSPSSSAFALLANPTNANAARETAEIEEAGRVLGVRLLILRISKPSDFEAAFANIAREDIGGILTTADPLFFRQRDRLIALVDRRAVPAIYPDRYFIEAGGLMSYGPGGVEGHRQAGIYVGRILSDEKAGDLPVQQVTRVELGINMKTAKMLGLTISLPLLGRADEVIE